MSPHRAEQRWFMVRHFQSKIGEAVAALRGLSSTGDLGERAGSAFGGAARQRGLPGWAAGLSVWAPVSKSKAQSYLKGIFSSHGLCPTSTRVWSGAIRSHKPFNPDRPRDRPAAPQELGRALGSLSERQLGGCMIFTHLKYCSLP